MSENLKHITQKRDDVLQELALIKEERNSFGLPKNKSQRVSYLIANPKIDLRNAQLSLSQLDAEKRLGELQAKLRTLRNEGEFSPENIIKKILLEVLPKEVVYKIFDEVGRRQDGQHPALISELKLDDGKKGCQVKELRELALNSIDYAIKARAAINKFIEDGMPEINKADYLLSVSSINKCLPPYSEMERIKNKIQKV